MARHGRRGRRRPFNLRRVRVATTLAVGALAASSLTSGTMHTVVVDPLRVISTDLSFSIADLGATIDDGQEIGLAHSDYSSTEIEEALEAGGSIDRGNKLAAEKANRLVRSLGQLTETASAGAGLDWNGGQPKKIKLNWHLGTGDSIVMWIRNGSGVVYTTGALLTVIGNMWVKDSV